MNRKTLALCGAAAAVAFAIWLRMVDADAATTPFGVSPPPEQGGSPFGGPLAPLFVWIALAQQHFYGDLVARMADLKANPWALWALLALSFAYGVFHAAGPGHGKAVISGYLVANNETVKRGIILSFASAFVQAVSAILVVGIAGAILHVTAVTMSAATSWFEVASSGLIAVVGGWLLWNKLFGEHDHAHFHGPLPASVGAAARDDHGHHDHHHDHHGHDHAHHDAHDHADDHAHGHVLAMDEHDAHDHADHDHAHDHAHDDHAEHTESEYAVVAKAASARRSPLTKSWSAIVAVGIRPCSGALIVLVFALSQGVFPAGIAATFAMALGTGLTVAILATLAVSARGLALRLAGSDSVWTERVVHWGEVGVAAAVLVFGLLLLGGSLTSALPGVS